MTFSICIYVAWEREPNLVKVVDLVESLFKRHTGLIALHHDVQIQINEKYLCSHVICPNELDFKF